MSNHEHHDHHQPHEGLKPILLAILAAVLYGISSPVSKLLLVEIPPALMAALLYLGAGLGMLTVSTVNALRKKEQVEAKMTRKERPYIIGMILLDIGAPIFLMIGLTLTTSSNASLLNNFEIVATSVIALFIFKEAIGKRLWIAIAFITLSSIILSVKDFSSFTFSIGSIFIIMACLCWGFENNCTRMLSLKDPLQIVVALGLMLIGTYFAVTEDHQHEHLHVEETHEHKHNHKDGHHNHVHDFDVLSDHTHVHKHEKQDHKHGHVPDLHHRHAH